jgi:hypothetical protein
MFYLDDPAAAQKCSDGLSGRHQSSWSSGFSFGFPGGLLEAALSIPATG